MREDSLTSWLLIDFIIAETHLPLDLTTVPQSSPKFLFNVSLNFNFQQLSAGKTKKASDELFAQIQ